MNRLKKMLHLILGILLIFVGIAGLVLPILNGIIPLLVGLIILSFESPLLEKHLARLASRNTVLDTWYKKLDAFMRNFFRK